ncbi:hypothetical protein PSACC_00383 [Paramicrosporidium saccamoebae]|uniref:Peptidase M48 domain-containing protein n=1 Tax=Paramicrosporidium saccamoebae TaxID=1246581 RepID=A0A2H9TPT5_9FUNG|nr:hypothetical protein PSACC_00383 [Paramicrosporidium saccamoebae]
MTAATTVLQDDGKASWQLNKQLVTKFIYGSFVFSLVLQAVASLAQILHLYQNHRPGLTFLDYVMDWSSMALSLVGIVTMLFYFIIFKRHGVAKVWKWACAGEMADKPLWVRSARFYSAWTLFWLLGTYLLMVVGTTGTSNMVIMAQYLLDSALCVALGLLLLKVSSWPRRHLACFVFCAAALLVDLLILEKILFVLRFAPALPRIPSNEEIFKLAEHQNFDTSRVRTLNITNAFYASSIFSEIIVIGGPLLALNGPDQTVAIMAHELGHRANRHNLKRMGMDLITETLCNAALFYFVIPNAEIFSLFGFESEPVIAALPIMDIFRGVASTLFQPVYMALSISHEYEADAYAVKLGHGKGLKEFFGALGENRTASKIFEYVFLSHPSNEHRVEAANALMNEKSA